MQFEIDNFDVVIELSKIKSWPDWCSFIKRNFQKVISSVDLIKPYKLSGSQLQDYYFNSFCEYQARLRNVKENKRRKKRYELKEMALKRLEMFENPIFVTIELKDIALNFGWAKLIRKLKTRLNFFTTYLLITDYGKQNNRLHYHGFVDLDIQTLKSLTKYKGHMVHNGLDCSVRYLDLDYCNLVFEYPSKTETYNFEDKKTLCLYCTKYSLKENKQGKEFNHKMYTSRNLKNI